MYLRRPRILKKMLTFYIDFMDNGYEEACPNVLLLLHCK